MLDRVAAQMVLQTSGQGAQLAPAYGTGQEVGQGGLAAYLAQAARHGGLAVQLTQAAQHDASVNHQNGYLPRSSSSTLFPSLLQLLQQVSP